MKRFRATQIGSQLPTQAHLGKPASASDRSDASKTIGDVTMSHSTPASTRSGASSLSGWSTLVERIANEDQSALSDLYDQTVSFLYGVACRILSDKDLAEEVTLDVYMQVWKNAASYDPARGSVMTWLAIMTRSRALDRRRALQRNPSANKGTSDQTMDPSMAENLVQETSSHSLDAPVHISALNERKHQVRRAISQLPNEQRDVIERAWFQGLTHRQIAHAVNQPLGTIKTRIRTGMNSLRTSLKSWNTETDR